MVCSPADKQITVEIPSVGLEIAPYSVDIRKSNGEFDYFKANFHEDVGNHIQDSVTEEGGDLNVPQLAYVKMEDVRVRPMLFEPSEVAFQRSLMTMNLLDPRKDLEHGIVDETMRGGTGKDILRRVFHQYKETAANSILDDIQFSEGPPAGLEETGWFQADKRRNSDQTAYGTFQPTNVHEVEDRYSGYSEAHNFYFDTSKAVVKDIIDMSKDVLTGEIGVDYKDMNTLEAFMDMKGKIDIDFWVKENEDGELILFVGNKMSNSRQHFAADNGLIETEIFKGDVFRIGNYSIRSYDLPIKRVIVKGNTFLASDKITTEDSEGNNELNWGIIDPFDEVGHDSVWIGVVERDDVGLGRTEVYDIDAPKENLRQIARQKMHELLQEGRTGQIEIQPAKSGKEWSDYRFINTLDRIVTGVPSREKCKEWSNIVGNEFWITSVNHTINDGYWSINLGVRDLVNPEEEVPEGGITLVDRDLNLKRDYQ